MKADSILRNLDFKVSGLSCNSKTVGRNFIFVAIKGNRQNGLKFIDEAIGNGAKVIVSESGVARGEPKKAVFIKVKDARKALAELAVEFYGLPSERINVVGVTGTNGKTTITYLLEKILKDAGYSPAVIGTINYRFKDKIIPSKNTTPGPVELQGILSEMLTRGVDYAVIEVSSHALDQNRTEGTKFNSAIFTNLTQDHLDYHKTMESYFKAKVKLFKQLKKNNFAVINNDDLYALRFKRSTPAKVITYGIMNSSDIMAKDIFFDVTNSKFRLITKNKEVMLKSRLIGRHNVYNILAAAAWAIKEGIDIYLIKSAIENFSCVPGRLERINCQEGFSVFVDYAHTDDALKNVINTLRGLNPKKIIVVFGCGGERDRAKRPKMGWVATELSDYVIITNDNPRSEDPKKIFQEIKKGIRKDNFCVIPERLSAIKKSLSIANSGDIVLVAGKGHESYQILKDRILDFDDRKIIKKCLS